jgi:hypothetical protein
MKSELAHTEISVLVIQCSHQEIEETLVGPDKPFNLPNIFNFGRWSGKDR